jgi:hypothetical protein
MESRSRRSGQSQSRPDPGRDRVSPDAYDRLLADMSDADFRAEMTAFDGSKTSKGAFIVSLVLGGHAAYRMQLFLYLKSCGRNTWAP